MCRVLAFLSILKAFWCRQVKLFQTVVSSFEGYTSAKLIIIIIIIIIIIFFFNNNDDNLNKKKAILYYVHYI